MVASAMRDWLTVLLAGLVLVLSVAPAFAEDAYPPPEGPVEVLPTVIEREPAPAPAPEPPPAVGRLAATGVSMTTIALVGLAIIVAGGAVLGTARRGGPPSR